MDRTHYEGFEAEEKFHFILKQALCECPLLKARTVKKIIYHVAPEFLDTLFNIRPCVRRLRYLGCGNICCEFPTKGSRHDNGLILGQIYESTDFNGATYKLKGYNRRIGAIYFKWVR